MPASQGRSARRRGPQSLPASRLQPVFMEPSGRRWRGLQAGGVLLLLALVGLAWLQISPALAPLRAALPGPDPQAIVDRLGRSPLVVGSGPMVRIAQVRDGTLVDPFRGAVVGPLTTAERAAVGTRPYVVQRYGYGGAGTGAGTGAGGPASGRRIVLTFDDGPDPVWTPKVLDVLARHGVHATFFVTGRAAASHPDLLRRILDGGNALGNHSLSHRDLSGVPDWRARLELGGNERLLADLTGRRVTLVRPPYDGGTSGSLAAEELALARAQRLGYAIASYDFDTHDWAYGTGTGDSAPAAAPLPAHIPLPPLDGRDVTVLVHDAGGNRAHTVDYLERTLIPAALAAGYTFTTVADANPGAVPDPAWAAQDPAADRSTATLVRLWLVYPNRANAWLFALAAFTLGATGFGYTVLAVVRRWRRPAPRRRPPGADPLTVSVLVAAYNEATVIEATLRSLVASTYPVAEFLVIDDGSTDGTADLVASLGRTLDPRIRVVRQLNGRKPAALNTGLAAATGEIVVTVDADTHASPTMVEDLVRHFQADPYGTLGAVAGVVRVGNRRLNVLTRWQALEYLTQIGIERAAHDLLGGIMIVPGACAAWRREAVLRAGGFSDDTLAEDCDLTLSLHRMGWRVTQDDDARADTEAPETVDALLKQRVRWTFGTLQAIAKHRDMVARARFGWLGTVLLPWAVVSVALPLVTIPFVLLVTVSALAAQGPALLGGYYLVFTATQALTALVAVRLLGEPVANLSVVPLYRAVYDPLRTYLLYMSCYLAARGVPVGWNKLARSGALNAPAGPPASGVSAIPAPRREQQAEERVR